ncbi:MAG: 30S ribosomal protein S18 [Chloroflexi bacterium]|nr:30S ribosomal protein S18 [Chloroflexota bacterium]
MTTQGQRKPFGRPGQGGPGRPRREGGPGGGGRRFYNRRRVCSFCVDKVKDIDYKDYNRLQRFLSERARIMPRRRSGTCTRHQRMLCLAIKRARHLALLPYTADHILSSIGLPYVARPQPVAAAPQPVAAPQAAVAAQPVAPPQPVVAADPAPAAQPAAAPSS